MYDYLHQAEENIFVSLYKIDNHIRNEKIREIMKVDHDIITTTEKKDLYGMVISNEWDKRGGQRRS